MTKLSKSTLPRSRWARVRERGQHALGARRDRPGHARTLSAEQRLPRRERIPWCERRRQGDASTLEPRARDAQPASTLRPGTNSSDEMPVPSTTLARGQCTTDADHRQQQESTSRTRWSARARGTFTRCKPTLAPETQAFNVEITTFAHTVCSTANFEPSRQGAHQRRQEHHRRRQVRERGASSRTSSSTCRGRSPRC